MTVGEEEFHQFNLLVQSGLAVAMKNKNAKISNREDTYIMWIRNTLKIKISHQEADERELHTCYDHELVEHPGPLLALKILLTL